MMNDEDQIIFREKLPKFVFAGNFLYRSSIVKDQWAMRTSGVLCLLGAVYIASIIESDNLSSDLHSDFGVVLVLIGALLIFIISERIIQSKLDGNARLIILKDRVSIPPRKRRRLIGKPNYVLKKDVDHILIKRGHRLQHINKDDCVIWDWAPIEIIIKTKNGMKYKSGPKPPNTILGALDVLRNSWGVRIDFSGNGMGTGTIYVNGESGKELPYEEIVKMNLFEWEE
jgi:hypothetical protein